MFIYKCTSIDKIIKPEENYNINPTRKKYLDKLSNSRKEASFLAWLLLKEIVLESLNLDIDKLELSYNEYGKPLFKEFYFSISHSNDLIAVAICNKSVGIDIQIIDDKNYNLLAKRMNIQSLDNNKTIEKFSAIEAYSKKIGTGLNLSYLKNDIDIKHQEIINYKNDKYVLSYDY